MTLQQMKYVLEIAERGSMNEAAKNLFISQPSLTSSIRELESELGIKIFNRSNRGIEITTEGSEFLGYVRQILEQYALMEEHYHEKSELRILYLNDFNEKILTNDFKENNLVFTELFSCDTYVYLSSSNPLAKEKKIAFKDLDEYPCLSFDQGEKNSFYYAEEVLSTYPYRKLIHVNDRATASNMMTLLNAYTLCSGVICRELNGGGYSAIPLASDEKMRIGYIKRYDAKLSAIAKSFIKEMKKYGTDAK